MREIIYNPSKNDSNNLIKNIKLIINWQLYQTFSKRENLTKPLNKTNYLSQE